MARPRIVDVDYHQFLAALRKASDTGQRIEVGDKTRWLAWVRDNHVKEAAFRTFAQGKYEGLEPVIIDERRVARLLLGFQAGRSLSQMGARSGGVLIRIDSPQAAAAN